MESLLARGLDQASAVLPGDGCARRGIQLTIVRVPLMRVSDHRLGDYSLETGDRLPFLRPDKIKVGSLAVKVDDDYVWFWIGEHDIYGAMI